MQKGVPYHHIENIIETWELYTKGTVEIIIYHGDIHTYLAQYHAKWLSLSFFERVPLCLIHKSSSTHRLINQD
jgi:hypothetical protein